MVKVVDVSPTHHSQIERYVNSHEKLFQFPNIKKSKTCVEKKSNKSEDFRMITYILVLWDVIQGSVLGMTEKG